MDHEPGLWSYGMVRNGKTPAGSLRAILVLTSPFHKFVPFARYFWLLLLARADGSLFKFSLLIGSFTVCGWLSLIGNSFLLSLRSKGMFCMM